MKSEFVNGLYHLSDGLFVNPFDTQAEMEALIKRIDARKVFEEDQLRKKSE